MRTGPLKTTEICGWNTTRFGGNRTCRLILASEIDSAELSPNTGWVFGQEEDERLFLEGFRATQLSLCAADADLVKMTDLSACPGA